MDFKLSMNLDDDDATQGGPDAVAGYLRDVASRVQAGYGNGKIRDVNGNTIGEFGIENVMLKFPGFPPIRGVGPVITEQTE